MAAKRYTTEQDTENKDGLTLLFAHCIGSHKEQWEPVISAIYSSQNTTRTPGHQRVREVWAFDWQSHGDSALLNRDVLSDEAVSVYEWASAIAVFIQSSRMKGHRIVALGHSAGAGAMMLTTLALPTMSISPPYAAIILIEPMMISQDLFYSTFDERIAAMEFAVEATRVRRDTWPSRKTAFQWMKNKFPWCNWDPRVLQLFTEYGLTLVNSNSQNEPVKLKTSKEHEALSYPDVDGHFHAPLELARVCKEVPVHIVWGEKEDFVPDYIQELLSDVSQGRLVASVERVKDAGHMVVQEKPDALASILCKILSTIPQLRRRGSEVGKVKAKL